MFVSGITNNLVRLVSYVLCVVGPVAGAAMVIDSSKPELVLYVDVNGTVTCKDSLLYNDELSSGELHPGLLIDILRSVKGVWEKGLPSMSYVQYIEQHKYPIAKEQSNKEKAAIEAKRNNEHKNIFSLLTPEQVAFWQKKYQEGALKLQSMDQDGHKKVFASFVCAIRWLQSENISFQVLLRTYGSDAKVVMEEVNRELAQPFFDCRTHKLTYSEDGNFLLQIDGQGTAEKVNKIQLSSRLAMLGNSAIRDDYDAWYNHGEERAWGKPFPVDSCAKQCFFDDWEGANTTIAPFDAKTGNPLPVDTFHIPPVSTFEMLLNDEAMISALKVSLNGFSAMEDYSEADPYLPHPYLYPHLFSQPL